MAESSAGTLIQYRCGYSRGKIIHKFSLRWKIKKTSDLPRYVVKLNK